MPELPEVETVVRSLRRHILGDTLLRVRFASMRVARENRPGWKRALAGRSVEGIDRRGKYILVRLADDHTMMVHLRMTGQLRVRPQPYRRQRHDRFIADLASDRAMILVDTRQFGRVEWVEPGELDSHPSLSKLGPDALTLECDEFRRILRRSHRPIKLLLLDQTRIAGLGNIYADESLHAAGIRPTATAARLGHQRVQRLHASIHDILSRAIAACGTTFDTFSDVGGEAGGFGPLLRVYQRDETPCGRCGSRIRRIVMGGRGTHFCPRCQR